MNIYDIANRAGVSIATVSRVINGKEHVSEKTRDRVLAVIREMGYAPGAYARGLTLGATRTVGLLCADVSDIFLANAVNHLEGLLRGEGYHSLLCCTGHEAEDKRRSLELLLDAQVDGLILVGSHFQGEEESLHRAAQRVPVVMVNGFVDAPGVYAVRLDHAQATEQATRRLLSQGRRVLYLYDSLPWSGWEKREGYRRAMAAAGQEPLELRCLRRVDAAQTAVRRALEKLPRMPLGILAAEDILGIGALKAAQESGRSVPEEVSLVGFHNLLLCRCCRPELTSIDSQVQVLCTQAVRRLMSVLAGEPVERDTVLSGEYVGRGTTLDHEEDKHEALYE